MHSLNSQYETLHLTMLASQQVGGSSEMNENGNFEKHSVRETHIISPKTDSNSSQTGAVHPEAGEYEDNVEGITNGQAENKSSCSIDNKLSVSGIAYQAGGSEDILPVVTNEQEQGEGSPSTDSKSSETGVVYQAGGYEDHLPVVTNGQEHGESSPSIDSNDRSKDSLPVLTNGQEHGGGSPSIDSNDGFEDNLPVVTNVQEHGEGLPSIDNNHGSEDNLPVVTNGQEYGEGLPSIDNNHGSEDNLPVVTNGQEHGEGSTSIDSSDGSEDRLAVVKNGQEYTEGSTSDGSEDEVQVVTSGELHAMGMELGPWCRVLGRAEEVDRLTSWRGVRVKSIAIGSFAHGFGLKKNDRLLEVNGQPCATREAAIAAFTSTGTENLKLTVQRWQKTVQKYEMSHSRGIVKIEEIDVSVVESVEPVGPYNLDRDTDVGPDEVYLKSYGPDKSLFVVVQNGALCLQRNISQDQMDTLALFLLHKYWDWSFLLSEYAPVVIQHKSSGLCVKLKNERVVLEEIPNLDTVPSDSPFVFRRKEIGNLGDLVAFFGRSHETDSFISFDNADGAPARAVGDNQPNTELTVFYK